MWEPKGGGATGNVKPLPDGRWIMTQYPRALHHSVPVFDTIRRDTFVPVTVSEPTPPVGTTDAYVRFGYDSNFYCSANRNEACIASTGTVNPGNPYFYIGVDGPQQTTCGSGCSVAIAAISSRVLFYQWVFLNQGTQIGTGRVEMVAVP